MVGKKNVVLGFLFLAFSAGLGPYMVTKMLPTARQAQDTRVAATGKLAEVVQNNYDDTETLAKVAPEKHARLNSEAILGMNQQVNAAAPIDSVKGGPHAHGNLEALLNIVAGLALCFVTCRRYWMKQAISWLFLGGMFLHSGMLYLAVVFNQAWAGKVLGTGVGPIMLLAALVLMGFASYVGFRGEIVRE